MTTNLRAAVVVVAALVMAVVLTAAPPQTATAERQLEAAIHREQVLGDIKGAIEQYKTLAQSSTRAVAAQALVHLGQCYEKLGEAQAKDARATYERVVRDYGDQSEAAQAAQARLAALSTGGGLPAARTEAASRRVWAGKDLPAGVSPDGRYFVFVSLESGGLWLRDIQSGEQRRITREAPGTPSSFALVSPDGRRVAYDWRVGSCAELRVSTMDGTSMKVVRPCEGAVGRPGLRAWMPDGRRILAVSHDPGAGVYRRHIISVADGTVSDVGQPVRDSGMYSSRLLEWGTPSPDGRHVAYGLKGDVFLFDTASGQDSPLVQNPAADSVVGWTPDGSGLLFVSDRAGTRDLYVLSIESGRPVGDAQVARRNFGDPKDFVLARDGRLFRIDQTGGFDSFIVPLDAASGKPAGSPAPVDGESYPEVRWPGWSRDGTLLYYEVFKGQRPRTLALSIRSQDTGRTRSITPNPPLAYWEEPVLSPDGRRFAVMGQDPNRNVGVFAVDAETGATSQLVRIPIVSNFVPPAHNWSPDGRGIYYKLRSAEKSDEVIVRRKDITTGDETDVHAGVHTREMKLSPDGTKLVYLLTDGPSKASVLGILDCGTGKEQELWRVPAADSPSLQTPAWTPDGRYVLVGKDLKQGTELWRFAAAGGPGVKLHVFPESSWGFVVHPGGRQMAFTQRRVGFELWVLENFLPSLKEK